MIRGNSRYDADYGGGRIEGIYSDGRMGAVERKVHDEPENETRKTAENGAQGSHIVVR